MRKIIPVVCVVIAVMYSGCDTIGEDPFPSPGPNPDGSVTLFVNGALYNFDYTAQYDGIQYEGYFEPKPDGEGGTLLGSQFLSLGSTEGGGFAGGEGPLNGDPLRVLVQSKYYGIGSNGTKSMAFLNDLKNNCNGDWKITLFDTPPMKVADYSAVSYWAKWDANPEIGSLVAPAVTLSVWTSSGIQIIKNVSTVIPGGAEGQRDGKWYKYTVNLNKVWAPGVSLPSGDLIYQWQISVLANMGRIYVDEIVLEK
jgi:hypothetical protein